MIDAATLLAGRPSTFELDLWRWLDERPIQTVPAHPSRTVVLDAEPHGRRTAGREAQLVERAAPVDAAAPGDGAIPDGDPVPAPLTAFAGLSERGAVHLAGAKAALLRQCEDAAVRGRGSAGADAGGLRGDPSGRGARSARRGGGCGGDRVAGGAPGRADEVSEWAVDEVMVALGLSSGAASRLLVESVSLVEQLPASLAALEAGTISWAHAQMLVEVLGPMGDDAKRAEVESRLLARAAGNTLPQLRVAARRVVLRADADAAASRLAAAIRDRQVRVFTGRGGMASLSATLPTPVALACRQALRRYAEACATPDDERTLEQRMVDCLADLTLRPGETGAGAADGGRRREHPARRRRTRRDRRRPGARRTGARTGLRPRPAAPP